ncbi:hypothetical protein [Streptomyces lydicus]|uniref:hypothetical protein n=1 Tax=Streptomyces lydicus TaxID=47763 RepID=UPI0010101765|nr:hypothetical protein [Streptomyces lydicus]MCZ1012322.1 hypothetical protein [Streptomyces lydicus]
MATNQRRAFAAEIASLARKYKGFGRVEAITKTGHTVLLSDMSSEKVGAIVITDPDGYEVRRADGWKAGRTAEIAEFLWDELEKRKARAAERERLAGLKSVNITSTDAIGGAAGNKETGRYYLTHEQLTHLLALAEQMASANAAVTATE